MAADDDHGFSLERARRGPFDGAGMAARDHDLLIEINEKVRRLQSDAESEKRTHADANARLHEDIGELRAHIDLKCEDVHERIDRERDKLATYINQRDQTHGSKIAWLERLAWVVAGSSGGELIRWLISRQ